MARRGEARHGSARQGRARLGKARQGLTSAGNGETLMIFIGLPVIAEKEERYATFVNAFSIHSITSIGEDGEHSIVVYGPQAKPLEVELSANEVMMRIADSERAFRKEKRINRVEEKP
jgi:hypothetical protein